MRSVESELFIAKKSRKQELAMNALLENIHIPTAEETKNQAWALDTSAFGHRMLLKMGWKSGKGLGKEENGMTNHVKVVKKIDDRGLGAEADYTGNSGWAEQQQSFAGVLKSLNSKYGGNADKNSSKRSNKDLKKKKNKEKRKRNLSSSEENSDDADEVCNEDKQGTVCPIQSNKKKSKRNKSFHDDEELSEDIKSLNDNSIKKDKKNKKNKHNEDKKDSNGDDKSSNHQINKKKESSSSSKTKVDRKSRHRLSRKRFIQSKNVDGYTPIELKAVLGLAS